MRDSIDNAKEEIKSSFQRFSIRVYNFICETRIRISRFKGKIGNNSAVNIKFNKIKNIADIDFIQRFIRWFKSGLFDESNNLRNEIFYIGGNDVLPPPLSAEEEREMTRRLANHDAEARSILIEHNLRLVVYIAKRFENSWVNVEDLISIGTIGLIKAVNTFDGEKNIKLATYASRCIENEILMYLRRTGKTRSEVSFDEPLNVDWDGNELLLSDILGTEEDVIFENLETEVNRKLLVYAMKKLEERDRRIVEMRFGLIDGNEMTQKEVADYMGISQSYISRLEKKIIGRMRREINKLG